MKEGVSMRLFSKWKKSLAKNICRASSSCSSNNINCPLSSNFPKADSSTFSPWSYIAEPSKELTSFPCHISSVQIRWGTELRSLTSVFWLPCLLAWKLLMEQHNVGHHQKCTGRGPRAPGHQDPGWHQSKECWECWSHKWLIAFCCCCLNKFVTLFLSESSISINSIFVDSTSPRLQIFWGKNGDCTEICTDLFFSSVVTKHCSMIAIHTWLF